MTYCVLFVNSYIYINNDNNMKRLIKSIFETDEFTVILIVLGTLAFSVIGALATGYFIHIETMAGYAR